MKRLLQTKFRPEVGLNQGQLNTEMALRSRRLEGLSRQLKPDAFFSYYRPYLST